MKFRLGSNLENAIEDAANEHGWAVSEEVRRRLENSFLGYYEADDEETRKVLYAISTVAYNINPAFGPWHLNRFAFDAFKAAVNALLDLHRPPGPPVRPSDNELVDWYVGEDGSPETAGRMLAGSAATAADIPIPGHRRKGS